MGIREEIGKVRDFVRVSLPHIHVSIHQSVERFGETVKEVQDMWGDLPPHTPTLIDLEEVYQRLRDATRRDDWSDISPQNWKRSPWVFWRDEPCLADHPRFLERYRRFLAEAGTNAVKTLIYVYLRDFSKERKSLSKIAALIRKVLLKNPNGPLKIWRERDKRYALFDPEQGASKLVQTYWQGNQSIEDLLATLGLKGELAQGGFVKEAYRAALDDLRDELNRGKTASLDKMLQWSEQNNLLRNQESGYYRIALAETLLSPWQEQDPESAVKSQIQGFLLRHYKDPRVQRGDSDWRGISESAQAVIKRWLAGEAIRLFFEILDKNSQYYDSVARRHWKYRRAFWWAYYKKEHLQEAWFAFASNAQRLAHPDLKREQIKCSFLDGSGVDPNHAILIMKIAGLTIVEWSHNGKCRIWSQCNKDTPKLYQPKYNDPSLKWGSDRIKPHYQEDGITHYSSESGGWQGDVEYFIYQHTGIRMNYRDYMPSL